VGLATVAPGVKRSDLVARLIPAYVDLLQQLKVRWFWCTCVCYSLRC
jgi:hypothetical protein